ncbi:MAG TPA: TetR/AcrR family transcriptional regulator [Gemmatimonadaceae bacterium]|nr:TetR/AcrR family transcriptional regulator [Gemmatimonadaceae bacterium]
MGKGDITRGRILDEAIAISSVEGVTGLTIGRLADTVGMSKSGLFAHFRSKEELQLQVLDAAAARFTERVVKPALAAPRGEPRIRELFEHWLAWLDDPAMPGGCVLLQAAVELDDQPGAPHEQLAEAQRRLRDLLIDMARRAVEAGHFRDDLDAERFAFELQGMILARNLLARLLRDPAADSIARRAFEALLAASRR